jgi:hypothetical protein
MPLMQILRILQIYLILQNASYGKKNWHVTLHLLIIFILNFEYYLSYSTIILTTVRDFLTPVGIKSIAVSKSRIRVNTEVTANYNFKQLSCVTPAAGFFVS